MTEDAFIAGLRAFFAANPTQKPSAVSIAAGLDNSTIRKMLDGSSSNPTRRTMERIAQQLNTTADAISAGHFTPRSIPANTGFAETQAALWRPSHDQDHIATAIAALSAGLRQPETYTLTVAAAGLPMMPGDILLIDIATLPVHGDTIIIGYSASGERDDMQTLVRRYAPPHAVSFDWGEIEPVLNLGHDQRVAWRGTVRHMLRPFVKNPAPDHRQLQDI